MTRSQLLPMINPLVQSRNSYLAEPKQRQSIHISKHCRSAPNSRMDILFIDALVAASSCQYHIHSKCIQNLTPKTPSVHHKARRKISKIYSNQSRPFHTTKSNGGPPAVAEASISRDECRQMLDYYIEPLSIQSARVYTKTSVITSPSSFAEESETNHRAVDTTTQENPTVEERLLIDRLVKLLDRNDSMHEEIMRAYSALPFPGVSYLSNVQRRLLLRRILTVERKNKENMFRYISLVDDMKAASLPMLESEWNSAISFIGRCFTHVRASGVKAALETWKDMEQKAGVRSGPVTFNILFDIATKAGKFVLAEMILKEMEARNLPLNRFARVGVIYYHGLKGDGDGIRTSYKAFVDAGEIVDTVVMNCVIASLIRAGEPSAADNVYERMKRMHALKTGLPPQRQNRKYGRDLGHVLENAAWVFRFDPERLRQLQTVLVPESSNLLHIYRVLCF